MKAAQSSPKIGIIGLGMVGAPLMRWFLQKGWKRGADLFCYDSDPQKDYSDDVSKADTVFICVPTPSNPDGSCNTSIVKSVVSQLPAGNRVIVVKSTVPPGTTADLRKKYKNKGHFLFNPEFLTEAQAWEDFIKPDRQIVAPAREDSKQFSFSILNILPMASFRSPGVEGTYDFYGANSTEAELAKYGGNTFGAIKVSFANILADFCKALNVDYENVRRLISNDSRINGAWTDVFHGKYRGFGGFCFPKDLKALIMHGEKMLANFDKKGKKEKVVFKKALDVLKSVWDYNEALLKSQGLTIRDVSIHDSEFKKNLENIKK